MPSLFRRILFSEYLVLWLCAVYFFIAAVSIPGFASGRNLLEILSVMLPLLLLATGQTLVVITAGIDLSIMSVVALSGVLGAMIMSSDGGYLAGSSVALPIGLLGMLVVGGFSGAFNGVCVALFRMPAFIVTLVTMMLAGGLAVWITQSKTYYMLPDLYLQIGKSLPIASILTLIIVCFAHVVLSRSAFGVWIYAIGQNPEAARVSGVPVRRLLVSVYVVSGLCAVCAAVLLTGRLESASPVLGKRMLLDVVGATVIGGTSLYGGSGKISWSVFGVLFLSLVDNSLNLLGASFAISTVAKGGVILVAAVVDALKRREKNARA